MFMKTSNERATSVNTNDDYESRKYEKPITSTRYA